MGRDDQVVAGRYQLLDVLARGATGPVYRARDLGSDVGSLVALELLRPEEPTEAAAFLWQRLGRLRHEHLLTPVDCVTEGERVAVVLPVFTGGTLAGLVEDVEAVPARFAAEVLRQLLAGLSALHRAGVAHRAVHPASVVLRPTGDARPQILLGGWSAVAAIGDAGAPPYAPTRYAAPEQLRDAPPQPAADLYAAAAVAAELVSGARWRGSGPGGAAESWLGPPPLADVIADLTRADPEARPGVGEVLDRLAHPELAWVEGAAGEVLVVEQPPLPLDAPHSANDLLDGAVPDTRRGVPADQSVVGLGTGAVAGPGRVDLAIRALADQPGDEPRAAKPRGRRNRRTLVAMAVAVVVVLLVAVVAWVTAGVGRNPLGVTGRSPAPPAVAPTSAPTPTASTAAPPSTAPTPTSSPAPRTSAARPTASPSLGSVTVGPVVVRPGQPCEFSEVGVRETTLSGDEVTCTRQADGSYVWEPSGG